MLQKIVKKISQKQFGGQLIHSKDAIKRHINSESPSKIKSKNTYCILLQYPQQKCHMFFKKLEKIFYSGVLTFTNRYK